MLMNVLQSDSALLSQFPSPEGMGFVRVVLGVILTSLAATSAAGFHCDAGGSTCRSLVGYKAPIPTTLGTIQTLFNVTHLADILAVNGLPESTPRDTWKEGGQVIRIPLECQCYSDTNDYFGLTKNPPKHKIVANDTLYHIARYLFWDLVNYTQIEDANKNLVPEDLQVGQEVVIPLPCGCGPVNERSVIHYGMALESGLTLDYIAQQYGSTPDAILAANDLDDPTQIQTTQALDFPLPACSSMVRNDSLDFPLLVPNGTYVYTANGCVRCKCDAAKNWILQCEPSHLKPTNWSTCPSMQCHSSSNMSVGNTIRSGSHNITVCAYAGYGSQTIFTTLATESIPPDNSRGVYEDGRIDHKGRWWIWLVVAGAVIFLPILCYLFYLIWRKYRREVDRKRKQKKLIWEIGGGTAASTVYHKAKGNNKDGKTNHEMQIFSFESIANATDNFSVANKLGEGGFGPVYKGKLPDGQEIAIKRLSSKSGQGLVEFKNEVKLIAKLQHTNLVRILGFCIQNEEKILIYEYMPNKSLDFYLFDSDKKNIITWEERFSIIQGIAQGLVYLHHYSRLKVIHRDLKASNILIDYEMNPKISDFGMARIFELKGIEENTKRIVGTYGYMSPEYAMNGVVSVKTDVFSFGVLVLEIVSGRKNNSHYHSDYPLNLIGFAWKLWNENRGAEIIDSLLLESCGTAEVLRCIQVGLLCVQDRAADRPSMLEVVSMLSNETILLPAPKQPAFFIDTAADNLNESLEQQKSCSINEATISVMDAR